MMRRVAALFFLFSIIFCSCGYIEFAKGELDDGNKKFIRHKNFFKTFAFSGTIKKKNYREESDDRSKYQIIINLEDKTHKTIPPAYISFQPYYYFIEQKQLVIGIKRDLYDAVTVGAIIKKEKDTDFAVVGNQKYQLLSQQQYEWLPN
jgi:hypothetical protein